MLTVPSPGPVYAEEPVQANSTVTLTANNIHGAGATLAISGHSGAWYWEQKLPYHPLLRCSAKVPAGTATVMVVGLAANTDYTFKAYSDPGCNTELTTDDTDAEFTTSRVKLSPSRVFVPEGGTADYTVSLHTAPTASVTVTLSRTGDGDITFDTDLDTTGNQDTLTFTTTNYANPQTVRLSADDDGDKTSDNALIVHTATSTDSNYSNITSTLTATENDNDVCQGTTAVGNATSGGLVDDCNILMAAKPVLSGSSSRLADWSTGTAIGSWTGITAGSRVTGIVIKGPVDKLGGAIPAGLGNLSNLTQLDLNNNNLTGPIPSSLGNLTKLTRLDLYNSNLTGPIPSSLGNLTKLTYLSLGRNGLSGPIPSLTNLTNLAHLDLNGNYFLSGSIPALGNLTKLTYLSLSNNDLSGSIPSSLGDLTNLTHLSLSNNDLTGAIPSSLGDLTNLTYLDLARNLLTGDVPGELDNLDKVTTIRMHTNSLTGCFPPVFRWNTNNTGLNPQNNNVDLPWCAGLAFYWKNGTIPEGNTFTWYGVSLATEPTADVTITVSIAGDPDITITSPTTLTFTKNAEEGKAGHWNYPHFVIMRSAQDADAEDGVATITHTATSTDSDYNNISDTVTVVEEDDDKGLFASEVKPTSAVLRISNHTGTWYYKHTAPTAGQCSTGVSGNTTTVTDLTEGASYTFKAYSNANCSTQLTTDDTDAEFTTPYFPVAPASVTATRVSKTLTVTWPSASHATGYNVRASYDNQATWQDLATNYAGTEYAINDLPLSEIVYVGVQSVNQYGKSTWTTAGPFNPVTPPPPASVSGTWNQQAATLTISWSSVEVAGSYNVNLSYGDPTRWQRVATNETSTSHVVQNATLNQVVYLAVQSVNAIGEGEWKQVGPINPAPPLAPDSVTASWDLQAETLNVGWTATATAAAYDVIVRDEERGWRVVGSNVSGTSFSTTDVAKQGWIYVGVRSVNPGGKSDYTHAADPVNPVPLPTAPAVSGTWDQATGVLTINWSSVLGATGYNVNINTHGREWKEVATNISETTLQVADIWTGSRLVMAVQSENSRGRSDWTWARLNDPPPQPGWITAAWDEDTKQVTISWSSVAKATSYNVIISRADRKGWIQLGTEVTGTSLTADNIHHGNDAWVGVESVSPGGISKYKYARTGPPPALAAPGSVSAAWENGALVVTWTAVDQATGYHVNTSTDSTQNWTRAGSNVQGTTLTIDNLDTSATYHVAVQAVNAEHTSAWTNAGPIDPPPQPLSPPAAPGSVTAAWENSALVVTWTAGDRATGYHVNTSTDGRKSWTRAASNVAGTTFTITGLGTSSQIYVAVASVNSAGVSGWTNADPVDPPQTHPVPAPSQPTSVTASWEGDTLVVSWAAAANASAYNVSVNDIKTNWTQVGTNVTGTSFEVTGLDNTGDVYVAVQSINSIGWLSNWTVAGPIAPAPAPEQPASPDPPSAEPEPESPPTAPRRVHANWGKDALVVGWYGAEGATGYNVNVSTDGRRSWTRVASNVSETMLKIKGVDRSGTVYVAVQAVNSAGESGWTNSGLVHSDEEDWGVAQ